MLGSVMLIAMDVFISFDIYLVYKRYQIACGSPVTKRFDCSYLFH